MELEDAKKSGAMALFGEKYHGKVRVVSMGDFSKELCGGTHVSNTAEIGAFKIISESGIAAGVRRIEALTGDALLNYYKSIEEDLHDLANLLKANTNETKIRLKALIDELKELKAENDKLKAKLAKDSISNVENDIIEVKGVKVLCKKLEGVEVNELRTLGDNLKSSTDDGVVVLASIVGGKVNLLAMAGDEAIKKGANAGNIIKVIAPIVGGGGGGRPNMAQAGGKNPEKIDEALANVKVTLEAMLQ